MYFTHFQEILEEDYNIKISYTALSNFLKAKGAKSPRKHNITTIEEANKFLKKYIPKFNKTFAIEPKNKAISFMELPEYVNLDYLLSVKYTRAVMFLLYNKTCDYSRVNKSQVKISFLGCPNQKLLTFFTY